MNVIIIVTMTTINSVLLLPWLGYEKFLLATSVVSTRTIHGVPNPVAHAAPVAVIHAAPVSVAHVAPLAVAHTARVVTGPTIAARTVYGGAYGYGLGSGTHRRTWTHWRGSYSLNLLYYLLGNKI